MPTAQAAARHASSVAGRTAGLKRDFDIATRNLAAPPLEAKSF